MPLIKSKSKAAFGKNVAAEVKAGKPVKQAVAIAYSTKRAVKKAVGGSLDPMKHDSDVDYYEARKSAGLPERPKGYTDADRKAIISGDIYKKQNEAKKAADAAFYAKHAAANAERDKKSREMTNKRRASAGLPPLKSGGTVTKKSGW